MCATGRHRRPVGQAAVGKRCVAVVAQGAGGRWRWSAERRFFSASCPTAPAGAACPRASLAPPPLEAPDQIVRKRLSRRQVVAPPNQVRRWRLPRRLVGLFPNLWRRWRLSRRLVGLFPNLWRRWRASRPEVGLFPNLLRRWRASRPEVGICPNLFGGWWGSRPEEGVGVVRFGGPDHATVSRRNQQ